MVMTDEGVCDALVLILSMPVTLLFASFYGSKVFLVCVLCRLWQQKIVIVVIVVVLLLLLLIRHRCCGCPCGGVLRMQKLKTHFLRTQSSNVLPLKPGVGQYIAMHATNFFPAKFYLPGPFTSISPQTSPKCFHLLAVANAGSWLGPQNKIGHLAHRHRQLMQVSVLNARGI